MANSTTEGSDYFSSYGDLSVHELMLKDRPRTVAYQKFFEENREYVKGKVVMDVGAGTGILSLFAAAAGAKKVYAVEASGVASLCKEVAETNNLDSVIEVLYGAVEDIALPEGTRVDIIVSEWMGFYLLHESMLDSVIYARDQFLAADGIVVPSEARLYFAPVDMSDYFQDRADYWSNLYGFDFSAFASSLNLTDVSQPLIHCLDKNCVKAEEATVLQLNLSAVKLEEVRSFSRTLQFTMEEESRIHGFALWFDVTFDTNSSAVKSGNISSVPVSPLSHHCLSTGPFDPITHWKQTVVFLPRTITVVEDVVLCCRMKMVQDSSNKRHYNITIELADDTDNDGGSDDNKSEECSIDGGEGSDDSTSHPTPCHCGSSHCSLISALVEKYDLEHQELEDEAEIVETEAEVKAAREIDEQIENEGWPMDSSTTDGGDG